MTPVSYYVPSEVTSPQFAAAFAHGCGGAVSDAPILQPGPVALFGTPARWPVLRAAQADARDWYYGDHAYFGRGQYYRVTKNAYQHDGRGAASPDRFATFRRRVQPWRRTGGHLLLCPNSAVYCGLHAFDVQAWLAAIQTTLAAHTDRAVRVRWKAQRPPIGRDLVEAWAVVVYSSAAALDALIAGVPVFVLAPFAAAARMGLADLTRIEQPAYPDDREPFLWALAHQQWTLQEMRDGVAWRALQEAPAHAA